MKESVQFANSFCFLVCLLDRGHITQKMKGDFYYLWVIGNYPKTDAMPYFLISDLTTTSKPLRQTPSVTGEQADRRTFCLSGVQTFCRLTSRRFEINCLFKLFKRFRKSTDGYHSGSFPHQQSKLSTDIF